MIIRDLKDKFIVELPHDHRQVVDEKVGKSIVTTINFHGGYQESIKRPLNDPFIYRVGERYMSTELLKQRHYDVWNMMIDGVDDIFSPSRHSIADLKYRYTIADDLKLHVNSCYLCFMFISENYKNKEECHKCPLSKLGKVLGCGESGSVYGSILNYLQSWTRFNVYDQNNVEVEYIKRVIKSQMRIIRDVFFIEHCSIPLVFSETRDCFLIVDCEGDHICYDDNVEISYIEGVDSKDKKVDPVIVELKKALEKREGTIQILKDRIAFLEKESKEMSELSVRQANEITQLKLKMDQAVRTLVK